MERLGAAVTGDRALGPVLEDNPLTITPAVDLNALRAIGEVGVLGISPMLIVDVSGNLNGVTAGFAAASIIVRISVSVVTSLASGVDVLDLTVVGVSHITTTDNLGVSPMIPRITVVIVVAVAVTPVELETELIAFVFAQAEPALCAVVFAPVAVSAVLAPTSVPLTVKSPAANALVRTAVPSSSTCDPILLILVFAISIPTVSFA